MASEIGVGIPKKNLMRSSVVAAKCYFWRSLFPLPLSLFCGIVLRLAGAAFSKLFRAHQAPLSFCLGIFELQTRKELLLMRNLARLLLFPTYNDSSSRFQNQQQLLGKTFDFLASYTEHSFIRTENQV